MQIKNFVHVRILNKSEMRGLNSNGAEVAVRDQIWIDCL
jgi:hypothetical protein